MAPKRGLALYQTSPVRWGFGVLHTFGKFDQTPARTGFKAYLFQ